MKTGSIVNISYQTRLPDIIDVECKVLEENGKPVLSISSKCGFQAYGVKVFVDEEPTMEMIAKAGKDFVYKLQKNMLPSFPAAIKAVEHKESKIVSLNPYKDHTPGNRP